MDRRQAGTAMAFRDRPSKMTSSKFGSRSAMALRNTHLLASKALATALPTLSVNVRDPGSDSLIR